ncbi:MAG: bifunctional adenosylcobinamide kinase/adenosylcobinamide-phosphate guanylyltransferase [Oscillospiraceae bacterium]|nr:bifunctional adenosylcobinamide kinase/adenosylcobinamide-phosphate guanylyltransferase [Oscillospiraceae bacterium]
MSTITVVTGGAASGKTRWAINYFATCDNVLYIHTGKTLSEDIRRRIEFNNAKNEIMWDILDDVDNPCELIKDHKFFIFDGIVSYTKKIMSKEIGDDVSSVTYEQKKSLEAKIIADVQGMMHDVEKLKGDMVIITVETGFSVSPTDPYQALLREIVGTVNQRIANIAHEVYLSTSGIQFKIK